MLRFLIAASQMHNAAALERRIMRFRYICDSSPVPTACPPPCGAASDLRAAKTNCSSVVLTGIGFGASTDFKTMFATGYVVVVGRLNDVVFGVVVSLWSV